MKKLTKKERVLMKKKCTTCKQYKSGECMNLENYEPSNESNKPCNNHTD